MRQLANALIFDIHDAVAPLPGSTPVRQMIVTRALGYLERLAVEAAGDETLQIELAAAYTQIGRVQGHPGEREPWRSRWSDRELPAGAGTGGLVRAPRRRACAWPSSASLMRRGGSAKR